KRETRPTAGTAACSGSPPPASQRSLRVPCFSSPAKGTSCRAAGERTERRRSLRGSHPWQGATRPSSEVTPPRSASRSQRRPSRLFATICARLSPRHETKRSGPKSCSSIPRWRRPKWTTPSRARWNGSNRTGRRIRSLSSVSADRDGAGPGGAGGGRAVGERGLRLSLSSNGTRLEAVGWTLADIPPAAHAGRVDVAGNLAIDSYTGRPALTVVDLVPAAP